MELLQSAQMRAVEAEAIASGAVSGIDLMERAGQGVVQAVLAEWPDLAGGTPRAVVLCGPGNNGGDGFVIARLLKQRGWQVEVFLHGDPVQRPADAQAAHDACDAPMRPLSEARDGPRPDLLVDALFGIGLKRPLPLEACEAFHAVKQRAGPAPCHVVAVDCPSGFDCDTGQYRMPGFPADARSSDWEARLTQWHAEATKRILAADLTVTFHAPKVGHYLEATGLGRLRVADIGLGLWHNEPEQLASASLDTARVRLVAPDLRAGSGAAVRWLRGVTGQGPAAHKFERGHALVISGGTGHGGAARMAARGALRAGAGLVTVACPPEAMVENAAQLNAVMLKALPDAETLTAMLSDDRITVICLGPGLGRGERARSLVRVVLKTGRRAVLDADALTSFEEDPAELFALSHDRVVMTPHDGEFRRLFPDLTGPGMRGRSRVEVVREAAGRSGATVLLKGAATVIARADGVASIHPALRDRAAPQLATAGAGDVLAGFITGLMASPMAQEPYRCVELAVWLHVECARSFGPGLIAEDLPEELPKVFRSLGL